MRNDYSSDKLVRNEFGIQVKEELTFIDARVLPPPMVIMQESLIFYILYVILILKLVIFIFF